MKTTVVLTLAILGYSAQAKQEGRKFPEDFLFGTATAAYQIEGGWNADGKGESIWDTLTHTFPNAIRGQGNGDIAADSYNNYKRDVEMMRELGLDAYRFSVAWSRILPDGFSNVVNKAGIDFYNNYINEMIKYGITPMVTLYHWDMPQKIQDLGGLTNPLFMNWFEDYARVVFDNFGDRVKHFITFNEPREICYEGYGYYTKAPRANVTGIGEYICAKNLVLAHAKAYHLYNNEFKPRQGGHCGITISVNWFGPLTDSDEDKFAADLKRQAEWGIYAEPIFSKQGGFPKEISERVAIKSKQQGFSKSRMPTFTDEERDFVKGAFDFFGVNHYTALLISSDDKYKTDHAVPSILDDIDAGIIAPEEWASSASPWLKMAPNSIYNALTYLKSRYGNITFYITENGWSSPTPGAIVDNDRVKYYRAALESVLNTIEAGVDLKGYMAWSLMDNFEWMEGYLERFGLYQVDFEDPARKRTARKSALVYKHIIKHRAIDYSYNPQNLTITIDEGH